ncbi:MAG: alpha/beta hydrolase [Acidimicrobiales bacterium]
MPLDPQAKVLLDQIAAVGAPSPRETGVDQLREAMVIFASLAGPGPDLDRVEDLTIPGTAGDIPARIYSPVPKGGGGLPVVLWYHGGGWTIGSVAEHDTVCRQIAAGSGVLVLSVGYRLAPEYPFPAGPDDCWSALVWASENALELGGDPARLAVAGDSAGGNLAAVMARRARDLGRPPLAFQLLVYPATDGTRSFPSIKENGEGYFLTEETMEWFWEQYVPAAVDSTHPDLSPLQVEDLSGLAPALIITAEFDPLRDEGEAYGEKLAQAGVEVTVSRYDGMIHAFFTSGALFDAAGRAVDEACSALRQAFGSGPSSASS